MVCIFFTSKTILNEKQVALFLEDIGFNAFIAGLNAMLTGMGLTEFLWPKDAATSGFSLFNAGGIICMIFGIGFSKPLRIVLAKEMCLLWRFLSPLYL